MIIQKINVLYFSPTGGVERIARFVSGELGRQMNLEPEYINFTRPKDRRTEYRFSPETLLVAASPVYAGRLPNKIMPDYKAKIFGENTPVIPLCVFGNRNYDEALREWVMLLEENGFQTVGAAAFAGRHAFSDQVGEGRPDRDDQEQMREFAKKAAEKLAGDTLPLLDMDRGEIGPYYTPLKADKTPAKFLKARPLTDRSKCSGCGACVQACPMGSIEKESMEATGLCIKCQACVRCCGVRAKYFRDADFLSHVAMLEENYTRRTKNLVLI